MGGLRARAGVTRTPAEFAESIARDNRGSTAGMGAKAINRPNGTVAQVCADIWRETPRKRGPRAAGIAEAWPTLTVITAILSVTRWDVRTDRPRAKDDRAMP